jgi:hypothetical protein
MEPPMNADWFVLFKSFGLRIERRVIDNRFISIELFADGRLNAILLLLQRVLAPVK